VAGGPTATRGAGRATCRGPKERERASEPGLSNGACYRGLVPAPPPPQAGGTAPAGARPAPLLPGASGRAAFSPTRTGVLNPRAGNCGYKGGLPPAGA
jgi:hypothetical protein